MGAAATTQRASFRGVAPVDCHIPVSPQAAPAAADGNRPRSFREPASGSEGGRPLILSPARRAGIGRPSEV